MTPNELAQMLEERAAAAKGGYAICVDPDYAPLIAAALRLSDAVDSWMMVCQLGTIESLDEAGTRGRAIGDIVNAYRLARTR